jgi:hypothetical protein
LVGLLVLGFAVSIAVGGEVPGVNAAGDCVGDFVGTATDEEDGGGVIETGSGVGESVEMVGLFEGLAVGLLEGALVWPSSMGGSVGRGVGDGIGGGVGGSVGRSVGREVGREVGEVEAVGEADGKYLGVGFTEAVGISD